MKLSNVKKGPFEAHTHWDRQAPTRILFVRHGETDWNVRRVIQGWKGTSLNSLGLHQAALCARRVKGMDLGISAVLCSDLKRARQTGAAVGKSLGLPVQARKDLRERCFGEWEGRSIQTVLADFKLGPKTRKDPFLAFDPKGGESMKVFAKRMQGFMASVLKEHAGRTVAAVSHGGPVRIAACLASGIPPKAYFKLGRPGNVSLTLLSHQGGVWWVDFYNDMAHLEQPARRRGPAQAGSRKAQEGRL